MAKKIPMRQCLGCHEMIGKKNMLRVVKTPEGQFMLDPTGKMNGRGAYICFSRECLENAIKSKGLERSFKMKIPEEIYDKLRKELSDLEK